MKTEHKYAQVLRWIADGESVQVRWGKHRQWMELPDRNEIVTDEILTGRGAYEFRIKPHTVKIGSREVEAPVLEPAKGQVLWACTPTGTPQSFLLAECHPDSYRTHEVRYGRAFASAEAAVAFHEASVAYILEQMQ